MGSLSLLFLLVFLFIAVPIAVLKMGYDYAVPLRKHKFSLPQEIRTFYFPYLLLSGAIGFFFWILGVELHWALIDAALFPSSNSKISSEDIANLNTFLFIIALYLVSGLSGYLMGVRNRKLIIGIIEKNGNFLGSDGVKMVGFWSAILSSKNQPVISVDLLSEGDILYSGEIYHVDIEDDRLKSIVLRDAKRFIAKDLTEIKGRNEETYDIPGKFTYFFGSKIKNINIRSMEEERGNQVIVGDDLLLDTDILRELLIESLGPPNKQHLNLKTRQIVTRKSDKSDKH